MYFMQIWEKNLFGNRRWWRLGIKTTRLLEKCGKMVFKIVSPTDDFEILRQ